MDDDDDNDDDKEEEEEEEEAAAAEGYGTTREVAAGEEPRVESEGIRLQWAPGRLTDGAPGPVLTLGGATMGESRGPPAAAAAAAAAAAEEEEEEEEEERAAGALAVAAGGDGSIVGVAKTAQGKGGRVPRGPWCP